MESPFMIQARNMLPKNNINIVTTLEEFLSGDGSICLRRRWASENRRGAEYVFMQIFLAGIVTAMNKAFDRKTLCTLSTWNWMTTDPYFFKLGQGFYPHRFCHGIRGVLPQDKTPGIEILQKLWTRYKSVDKFETPYREV